MKTNSSTVRQCLMPPPPLENGRVEQGSNVVGSVVTYICDTGYQFSNMNRQRTCMIDQTWSNEEISCEKGIFHFHKFVHP